MKAVRLSRSLIVVIALVVSLGANAALFVGGVVYDVVDEFVDGAFGLATAAATQRRALTALKTASAKQAKTLAASKAVVARQRKEVAALRAAAVKQGKKLAALRATSGKVAKQSRDRLVKSVRRSILTAPGKALPYAGIPIVVGLTAWEIKDLCETIRNMNEIQKAAGAPEAEVENEPFVCERPDLAVERAVAKVESYSRKEWDEYKKYVRDLPAWEDIPDSWREAWQSIVPDALRGGLPSILDRMKRLLP